MEPIGLLHLRPRLTSYLFMTCVLDSDWLHPLPCFDDSVVLPVYVPLAVLAIEMIQMN